MTVVARRRKPPEIVKIELTRVIDREFAGDLERVAHLQRGAEELAFGKHLNVAHLHRRYGRESRWKATARVSLGPYLPRSNPSLLPSQRTLQNPHLNDKPVPLEELNRCAARYGKKGTAPGQSA